MRVQAWIRPLVAGNEPSLYLHLALSLLRKARLTERRARTHAWNFRLANTQLLAVGAEGEVGAAFTYELNE